MSIQTASVEFTGTPEGGYHLIVRTPHGTATCPVDRAFIVPHTPEFRGIFTPNPELKPRKVSAKRTKRASIAQENEVMDLLGGRRHPGSGAIPGLQGDGRVRDKYRVEMKHTRQAGYRVDRKDLNKVRGECTGTEVPLFVMDFVDPRTGGSPDRWVMIPFEAFQRMDQNAASLDSRPPATR